MLLFKQRLKSARPTSADKLADGPALLAARPKGQLDGIPLGPADLSAPTPSVVYLHVPPPVQIVKVKAGVIGGVDKAAVFLLLGDACGGAEVFQADPKWLA